MSESPVPKVFDAPYLRLSGSLSIMLGKDNDSGDRVFPGTVGIKITEEIKNGWVRLSYMDFKKMMDFCTENRDLFNSQLRSERSKILVEDI